MMLKSFFTCTQARTSESTWIRVSRGAPKSPLIIRNSTSRSLIPPLSAAGGVTVHRYSCREFNWHKSSNEVYCRRWGSPQFHESRPHSGGVQNSKADQD